MFFHALFSPQRHYLALKKIAALFARHSELIWEMTKSEMAERHSGQIFGAFWTFGLPIAMIGVYLFVFNYIFVLRMPTEFGEDSYSVFLLSGLIPWLLTSEMIAKGTWVVLANNNLVKQVVFPVEVLPIKTVLASILTLLIFIALLLSFMLVSGFHLSPLIVFLPLVILIHALGMIGIVYVLSSICVYFRDLKDFMQIFTAVGLYITPALYPPGMLPTVFENVFVLNPFSYIIWLYQDVLYFGVIRNPNVWIGTAVGAIVVFYFGHRFFNRLKPGFGGAV